MRYLKFLIIGMLLASLALAGCSQPQQDTDQDVPMEPEDQEQEPEPEAQIVEVTLDEFGIAPTTMNVEAGPVKFEVANSGNWRHEFEIEGNGVEHEVEGGIPAGETRNLEVELQPGTYRAYCPIPGHEEKGMVAELVVS